MFGLKQVKVLSCLGMLIGCLGGVSWGNLLIKKTENGLVSVSAMAKDEATTLHTSSVAAPLPTTYVEAAQSSGTYQPTPTAEITAKQTTGSQDSDTFPASSMPPLEGTRLQMTTSEGEVATAPSSSRSASSFFTRFQGSSCIIPAEFDGRLAAKKQMGGSHFCTSAESLIEQTGKILKTTYCLLMMSLL